MPPTDPREAGITPSRIAPASPVVSLDLDAIPKAKRTRSIDKPYQRKSLCRNTAQIGTTQFRCEKQKHAVTDQHIESGVLTDKTGRVIMKYSFSWTDSAEPLTIRTQTHATKPNSKN